MTDQEIYNLLVTKLNDVSADIKKLFNTFSDLRVEFAKSSTRSEGLQRDIEKIKKIAESNAEKIGIVEGLERRLCILEKKDSDENKNRIADRRQNKYVAIMAILSLFANIIVFALNQIFDAAPK